MMEQARRRPSTDKSINEICEKDFRVRILGNVIDRNEADSLCTIDDGTGRATVFFASHEQFTLAETGKLFRITGKVRENNEIEVEIIQDMSLLDTGLVEQVEHVLEKLR